MFGVLKKLLASLCLAIVCFMPVWTFLLMKSLLGPKGFWQNLVLGGLAVFLLGGLQFFLFLGLLYFLFKIWTDVSW